MSFINLGEEFEHTQEAALAPEGEYDLKIIKATNNEDKKKIDCIIDFDGEDYQGMFHSLWLPDPQKDAEKDKEKGHEAGSTSKFKRLMIKRFLHAFNIHIDTNGFDINDLLGAEARLGVVQDSYTKDDGTVLRSNKPKIPNLPEEPAPKKK